MPRLRPFAAVLAIAALPALAFSAPATPAVTPSPASTSASPSASASVPVPTLTPRGVAMTANDPDSITLSWHAAPEGAKITGYTIYSATRADGPFSKVATSTGRTATIKKLNAGTSYFFKVSATDAKGESPRSEIANGFTIAPWTPAKFPVRVAKNMCLSLDAKIISSAKPISGTPQNLVDGLDSTSCRLRKAVDLKIKLNADVPFADAEYLLINFRTDCGPVDWSNDTTARTLKKYTIVESLDSTDGVDGTWTDVLSGTNRLLDGVIVIPNHKPKWLGLRSAYATGEEIPKADDRRPMPSDLILSRLAVFRSAPAGYRNDYWIFTGDSLVVQDMPAGKVAGRGAYFSDLIRQKHPDRYPIVVHAARGGERLKDTLFRTREALESLSPKTASGTPVATIVCWKSGYNDVGVGGTLGYGASLIGLYEEAKKMCDDRGLIIVPARLEFSTQYLDLKTLEPAKYNVFVNTLAVNLGGVDVFARKSAPYACDPKTQLPYADYWSYTRANHATALTKDGVHHTKEGSDGINQLWADAAEKMVYAPTP